MLTKVLKRFCSSKKKIYSSESSKNIILNITSKIANIAGITLGPKGRNVLIQNELRQQPRITKDGVTVVKHLQFQNVFQNAIATLIKKSVQNTNKFAGDGTTSSTIMIGQIVKSSLQKLLLGLYTSRQIRQGLKIARSISLDYLQAIKKQIQSQQQLMNVAMISTNGDKQLSKLISQAIWKSKNVSVEKSNTKQTYLQYFSGLKLVRGVPHPQFKNHGDKIVYNYPLVITSKIPLQSTKQIIKILQMAKQARKQLMIFSEKISPNILSTLIYNKRKNIIQCCGIQIPPYGEVASKYLQLISQSTGSLLFDKYSKNIQQIQWSDIGKAAKITVDQFQTEIRGRQKQNQFSAIIYVGGNNQTVIMEKYDKVVDALNSVQTAKKKGIVAGAGLTYWNLANLLDSYQGQFAVGVKVMAQALRAPRRKLYQTVQPELQPFKSQGWTGLNLKTNQFQDMFEAGIVDSVEVCKNVIIDSISLASQLIQVQIGVIPLSKDKKLMSVQQMKRQYKL